MAWYLLRTRHNSKDMFGEVAYVELEPPVSEEDVRERVRDAYPRFNVGHSVKSFSEVDLDIESERFDDRGEFLSALGEAGIGKLSNSAYSKEFGWVSTKEARRLA